MMKKQVKQPVAGIWATSLVMFSIWLVTGMMMLGRTLSLMLDFIALSFSLMTVLTM